MGCVVATGGACCALFSLLPRVCCRVQDRLFTLHYAAAFGMSEAGDKEALLAAYPDAAKEKDRCVVAAGGASCALFSLPPHMRSMPSPRPFSLAAVQVGKRPKDYADTRTRSRRSSGERHMGMVMREGGTSRHKRFV